MLKSIKNKSVEKAVVTCLKKRTPYVGTIRLNKIAVVTDVRQNIDLSSLQQFAHEFAIDLDKFSVVAFKDQKQEVADIDNMNVIYYSDADFSITGDINTTSLRDFVNDETIDVLINFYDNEDPYLNFVASASKAKFKVGFACVNNGINDLVLGVSYSKQDLFVSELKKYLKILEII